jgi:hypothetical protein
MQLKVGQRYKITNDYVIMIIEITNVVGGISNRKGRVCHIISDKDSIYCVGNIYYFNFIDSIGDHIVYEYLEGQDAVKR